MAKTNKNRSHHSVQEQAQVAQRRAQTISEIKAMAAKANARLRALEKAGLSSSSNAYRYLERRHFDKDTAIVQDRSGRIKFDTALSKKTSAQLSHEKRELERFLYESKTSTVRGTNNRYKRAFETYKKNIGTNIDRKTFDLVARAEGFAAFVKTFGSSQIKPLMERASGTKDDAELQQIIDALGTITPAMSLTEFEIKAALPPTEWLSNDAEEEDEPLPDASAWGPEDANGFMNLDHIPMGDEFEALPKKRSPRKRSGDKRGKKR